MRMTRYFLKTLRETAEEIESVSHGLCLRAGLIQMVFSGHYNLLPLGTRAIMNIERIIREEMDAIGSIEVSMSIMMPQELWEESGRWESFGPVLFRVKNRRGQMMCLGPTHEESVTFMARANVQSYKDLPVILYQIGPKLRDEPRARGGLLRAREFIMKDAYSFERNEDTLDANYEAMRGAYLNIFRRCKVDPIVIEADSGAMGGKSSNEFMVASEVGEDNIIICDKCQVAMNQEMARFDKKAGVYSETTDKSFEKVSTPGTKSIEDLSAFLKVKAEQCLKCVLYRVDGKLVMAIIRGDLEVNDVKIANTLKSTEIEFAGEEELVSAGIVPGFASPIGASSSVRVVVDDSVDFSHAYVSGANEVDFHRINVVPERDFPAHVERADIATATGGAPCEKCGTAMRVEKGIEIGHIFKLGTRYSNSMGATFTDEKGEVKPIIMGCYGIGVTRLMSAIIENNHDDKGVIWPAAIAPFQVHLLMVGKKNDELVAAADAMYGTLKDAGLDVLYDDREESPGVKFNDADLVGLPVRVVVSTKTMKENAVEIKLRSSEEKILVPTAEATDTVIGMLKAL